LSKTIRIAGTVQIEFDKDLRVQRNVIVTLQLQSNLASNIPTIKLAATISKSGRGLPQSKTLAREPVVHG
jgi:hypothetical protein